MSINIAKRLSKDKEKTWYIIEWGKGKGQRLSSGVFTYTKPKDQLQKSHNKKVLAILESKKSQMILDSQAIDSGYIPQHKLKNNFLDYYAEFVQVNRSPSNRHLKNSLSAFKEFIKKGYLSPMDVTENLCEPFRAYFLSHFNAKYSAGLILK